MDNVRQVAVEEEGDRGPAFVCAFCHSPFRLPPGVPVRLRYVGRAPEVECADCTRKREALETPEV